MTGKMTVDELFDAILAKLEEMNELLRGPARTPLSSSASLPDADDDNHEVDISNSKPPASAALSTTSSTSTPPPDSGITNPAAASTLPAVVPATCWTQGLDLAVGVPAATAALLTSPSSSSASVLALETSSNIRILTPKLPQASPTRCLTPGPSHDAYDSVLVAVSASSPSKLVSFAPVPSSPTSALVLVPTAASANVNCSPNLFVKALRYFTVATSTRAFVLLLREVTAVHQVHEIGELLAEQNLEILGPSHFMHHTTLLLSDNVACCVLNQDLMQRPTWPPPKQFGIKGVGVQVRPIPWPSFGGCTAVVYLHSRCPYPYDALCKMFSGEAMSVHWKLPWPLVHAFSIGGDKYNEQLQPKPPWSLVFSEVGLLSNFISFTTHTCYNKVQWRSPWLFFMCVKGPTTKLVKFRSSELVNGTPAFMILKDNPFSFLNGELVLHLFSSNAKASANFLEGIQYMMLIVQEIHIVLKSQKWQLNIDSYHVGHLQANNGIELSFAAEIGEELIQLSAFCCSNFQSVQSHAIMNCKVQQVSTWDLGGMEAFSEVEFTSYIPGIQTWAMEIWVITSQECSFELLKSVQHTPPNSNCDIQYYTFFRTTKLCRLLKVPWPPPIQDKTVNSGEDLMFLLWRTFKIHRVNTEIPSRCWGGLAYRCWKWLQVLCQYLSSLHWLSHKGLKIMSGMFGKQSNRAHGGVSSMLLTIAETRQRPDNTYNQLTHDGNIDPLLLVLFMVDGCNCKSDTCTRPRFIAEFCEGASIKLTTFKLLKVRNDQSLIIDLANSCWVSIQGSEQTHVGCALILDSSHPLHPTTQNAVSDELGTFAYAMNSLCGNQLYSISLTAATKLQVMARELCSIIFCSNFNRSSRLASWGIKTQRQIAPYFVKKLLCTGQFCSVDYYDSSLGTSCIFRKGECHVSAISNGHKCGVGWAGWAQTNKDMCDLLQEAKERQRRDCRTTRTQNRRVRRRRARARGKLRLDFSILFPFLPPLICTSLVSRTIHNT